MIKKTKDECNSGIYQIVNKTNGKLYIGSTVDFTTRKSRHFTDLYRGRHANNYLQSSYNKDPDAFEFFIVEYCNSEKCVALEQEYLDLLYDNQQRCYNIYPVAYSCRGVKRTKEQRRKMSEIQKRIDRRGDKHPMWGKTHTKEARQKISDTHLNKIFSDDRKRKISEAQKGDRGYWFGKTGEKHPTSVKIIQLDKSENVIEIFHSIQEAKEKTGIMNISAVLSGRTKTAGGFIWRYYD